MISESLTLKIVLDFNLNWTKIKYPKSWSVIPGSKVLWFWQLCRGKYHICGNYKKALDEKIPTFEIKWGTKIFRYWGCWCIE